MRRTVAVCMCSFVLPGSVGIQRCFAQMPIDSAVADVLSNSKWLSFDFSRVRPKQFQGTLLLCGGGIIPHSIRHDASDKSR